MENVRWNAFCKVFPECFDLYLEHDDNVALVENVAGSIDGHPGEVLDLLWVPGLLVVIISLPAHRSK